jgi:hypothetical protein
MKKLIFLMTVTLFSGPAASDVKTFVTDIGQKVVNVEKKVEAKVREQAAKVESKVSPTITDIRLEAEAIKERWSHDSIMGPVVRSYMNDTVIVWFLFDRSIVREINSAGEAQHTLSPAHFSAPDAQEGEHAFIGTTTVLGKGQYYFANDYGQLRVQTEDRKAPYLLRETPLTTVTPLNKAENE